jgi:hypothetical protein
MYTLSPWWFEAVELKINISPSCIQLIFKKWALQSVIQTHLRNNGAWELPGPAQSAHLTINSPGTRTICLKPIVQQFGGRPTPVLLCSGGGSGLGVGRMALQREEEGGSVFVGAWEHPRPRKHTVLQ